MMRGISSRLLASSNNLKNKSKDVSTREERNSAANFDITEVMVGHQLVSTIYADVYEVKDFRQRHDVPVEGQRGQFARDMMCKQVKRKRNAEGRFAIKHIRPEYMESHQEFEVAATSLANEADMMAALNHKNIARLRGSSIHGTEAYYMTGRHDAYFLIVDRCHDSLDQRLCKWRSRNDRIHLRQLGGLLNGGKRESDFLIERLQVAYDIADGLEYMHAHGIVHKNIHERSIGFSFKDQVQIHDLGEAMQIPRNGKAHGSNKSRRRPFRDFVSPELEAGEAFSIKTDVFSFTRLFCEILTLRNGQGGHESREGKACIREFRLLAHKISGKLLELLRRGISFNPEYRPSMANFRLAIEETLSALDPKRKSNNALSGYRACWGHQHGITQVKLPFVPSTSDDSMELRMHDATEKSATESSSFSENPFSAPFSYAK